MISGLYLVLYWVSLLIYHILGFMSNISFLAKMRAYLKELLTEEHTQLDAVKVDRLLEKDASVARWYFSHKIPYHAFQTGLGAVILLFFFYTGFERVLLLLILLIMFFLYAVQRRVFHKVESKMDSLLTP